MLIYLLCQKESFEVKSHYLTQYLVQFIQDNLLLGAIGFGCGFGQRK